MGNRLKILYEILIENRKHEVDSWHADYKDFHEEVKKKVDKLLETKCKLSADTKEDKDFLKKLLFEKANGVASRGQSNLSKENFEKFINDSNFLSLLSDFICKPDLNSFKKFEQVWKDQSTRNNPLLVNRVAAACTDNVTTTVDKSKFNQVFNWLVSEKLIDPYPPSEENNWYSKNVFLFDAITSVFQDELKNDKVDKFYLSQFIWYLYENISNPFSLKKQVIKYGVPGTGKTYQAKKEASILFDFWKEDFAPKSNFNHEDQIEMVQFHPSYSYEDFIEGLRPIPDKEGVAQLRLQNGVFKDFCRKAGKWELDIDKLKLDKEWDEISISDIQDKKLDGEHWKYIFSLPDHSQLLRDVIPPFFFIIDEVNRAELSRVFGELMYCLEYRGVKGCIKTQYANLNTEETGMLSINEGYQFFIPSNLYVLGTMNTIDRSIESFDFALRRRFKWEKVDVNIQVLKHHLGQYSNKRWKTLADNLDELNEAISKEPLLGEDYKIGHAYLMNLKYNENTRVEDVRKFIWEDQISPLIHEYLRGTGKETELIGGFQSAFGIK